jgi:tyrosyl-tRNA synthetase
VDPRADVPRRGAADAAREHFERTVIQGEVPDEIPEVTVAAHAPGILEVIRAAGFASSNGEARRFVLQNAVSIDGEKVADPAAEVPLTAGGVVLRVGKRRYARIVRG